MDCKNYSYILIAWANDTNTPSNGLLGAKGLKYSTVAQAAISLLTKPAAEGGKSLKITVDAIFTEVCD